MKMKHLKKFEELEYTSTEKRDYQSKIDSIVDSFATMVEFKKFDRLVNEKPTLKINVNIDDSVDSTLAMNFSEISINIYKNDDGKFLYIYKPGNGWSFTKNSIDGIMRMITKSKDYLDMSESEFNKVLVVLSNMVDIDDHIRKDISL